VVPALVAELPALDPVDAAILDGSLRILDGDARNVHANLRILRGELGMIPRDLGSHGTALAEGGRYPLDAPVRRANENADY
jgi:hypothetical protein